MTSLKNQREVLKAQRGSQKKKTITSVAAVIGVVVVALLLLYFIPRRQVDGPSVGDPNAPVKVEQFSNFTCSYCRSFALESEPDFIKEYVDSGKVYLTYFNYQFQEDDSSKAAKATYCAGEQNKFWDYKKLVYQNATFAGAFADESLRNYASNVGLNMADFEECLESDRQVKVISDGRQYAQMLGVNATPTFSVNGKLVYQNELIAAVDAALAEAGQ
ncbi:MAG: thioredoxin domain-containing protein [Chloroflexi bacterium]|nr:thioredoxin domain-containing protein [Chloroflexota bacterium]